MSEATGVHHILGPFEGDRMLVAGIGGQVDSLAHLPRGGRAEMQQDRPREDAGPDFDLIQPGGMGRGVMEVDVVEDNVEFRVWVLGEEAIHEVQELPRRLRR